MGWGVADRLVAPQMFVGTSPVSFCCFVIVSSMRGEEWGGGLSTPSTPSPTILSGPSSHDPTHHPQKTLVMSESRLKIQATSGTEIRTKVQDTPFKAWQRLLATPPNLCSSASSSSWFPGSM